MRVSELFLLPDPLVRQSLCRRISRLSSFSDVLSSSGNRSWSDVAILLNRAALIYAEAGQFERARQLCVAHFRIFFRQYGARREPDIVAHCLQPWINLGRLHAVIGEVDQALTHFGLFRACEGQQEVHLFDCPITAADWSLMLRSSVPVVDLLRSVLVLDTAKALLRAGRDEQLGQEITQWQPHLSQLAPPVVDELKSAVEVNLRHSVRSHHLQPESQTAKVVWTIHAACDPTRSGSGAALRAAARSYASLSVMREPDRSQVRLGLALATHLLAEDRQPEAARVLVAAHDRASAMNETLLAARSLQHLQGLPEAAKPWAEKWNTALRHCWYAELDRWRSPDQLAQVQRSREAAVDHLGRAVVRLLDHIEAS